MKAARPVELDGIVVGDVAIGLLFREEIPPPRAEGSGRGAFREPLVDVPNVDGLLDHPVARPASLGQPVFMAIHRAVAAEPSRRAFDQVAEFASADLLDPLAKPRIDPPLIANLNHQLGI